MLVKQTCGSCPDARVVLKNVEVLVTCPLSHLEAELWDDRKTRTHTRVKGEMNTLVSSFVLCSIFIFVVSEENWYEKETDEEVRLINRRVGSRVNNRGGCAPCQFKMRHTAVDLG